MADSLRYYIAHNGGLKVMENPSGSMSTIGEFFEGKTLEHLIGCKNRPEVVFAAVAFDEMQTRYSPERWFAQEISR